MKEGIGLPSKDGELKAFKTEMAGMNGL